MTSIEMSARISALEEELARLPMGNLVMKKIKGIFYRGVDQDLTNGIVYRNVEKWLKQR